MKINKLLLSIFLIVSNNTIFTMAPRRLVYFYNGAQLLAGKTAESIELEAYNSATLGFPAGFEFLPNTAENRRRIFRVATEFTYQEIFAIGIVTVPQLLYTATCQINMGLKA